MNSKNNLMGAVILMAFITLTVLIISIAIWSVLFFIPELVANGWNIKNLNVYGKLEKIATLSIATAGGVNIVILGTVNYRKQKLEEVRVGDQKYKEFIQSMSDLESRLSKCVTAISPVSIISIIDALNLVESLSNRYYNLTSNSEYGDFATEISDFNQRCVNIVISLMSTVGTVTDQNSTMVQKYALSLISRKCAKRARNSWSNCSFIFDNINIIVPFDLHDCQFYSSLKFSGVVFNGGFILRRSSIDSLDFTSVKFYTNLIIESSEIKYVSFVDENICFCSFYMKEVVFANKVNFTNSIQIGYGQRTLTYPPFKVYGAVEWLSCMFLDGVFWQSGKVARHFEITNCSFDVLSAPYLETSELRILNCKCKTIYLEDSSIIYCTIQTLFCLGGGDEDFEYVTVDVNCAKIRELFISKGDVNVDVCKEGLVCEKEILP